MFAFRTPRTYLDPILIESFDSFNWCRLADCCQKWPARYAVSALKALPWLRTAEVLYWGDIDTHGSAILDRARKTVPQIRSVLMDEATLLAHQSLWVQEPLLCSNAETAKVRPSESPSV
ncbi:Wadjet anti-phage system protein JetD domain-containing protein [Pusillimonas noertemannii]|uniref:Wadjet anti-phage system protein JetD domain-containing protein n=1 Tax=Pusillimonas noertemannii TaxID=305977 RepID=UPI000E3010CA|nr:hypothetical protein [Pusillimonas noertemannii]TFL11998.1 hypothetical protein CSC72_02400 [Pusillimonas noertemannii]